MAKKKSAKPNLAEQLKSMAARYEACNRRLDEVSKELNKEQQARQRIEKRYALLLHSVSSAVSRVLLQPLAHLLEEIGRDLPEAMRQVYRDNAETREDV